MRSDIKKKLEDIERGLALDPDPTLTTEERLITVLHKFFYAFAGKSNG
jgi:hypothetical protein